MQPRVSLNQFSFPLCALPPCHAIPTASQSCLVKAAVEQAPCWAALLQHLALQILLYSPAEEEASLATPSFCVVRGKNSAGRGAVSLIWLIGTPR